MRNDSKRRRIQAQHNSPINACARAYVNTQESIGPAMRNVVAVATPPPSQEFLERDRHVSMAPFSEDFQAVPGMLRLFLPLKPTDRSQK